MGSKKDKLLRVMGFGDPAQDDDYYDEDIYYEDEPVDYEPERLDYQEKRESRLPSVERFSSFMSSGNSQREERVSDEHMRIGLVQPMRFEDAQQIARYILDGKIVVFDLSQCDIEDAINIVNFVSGAIFALDGSFQKVNERGSIFVAVPPNVTLDNELRTSFNASAPGDDYGPKIAEWVNRTHQKGDF